MSGRNPGWEGGGGYGFWDRVRDDRNAPEQPTVKVRFNGEHRRFPAHSEQVRGIWQLVPDSKDGIEFMQSVDGEWHAYETQRG